MSLLIFFRDLDLPSAFVKYGGLLRVNRKSLVVKCPTTTVKVTLAARKYEVTA